MLISGANGGLGRLALQLLQPWGCRITAICGHGQRQTGLDLGAEAAVERGPGCIESLPADFDVVLNFGELGRRCGACVAPRYAAMGQATTVHPLLGNFDRLGWLRGAWASRREWKAGCAPVVASRAPQARYAWTVFKPDREALDALAEGIRAGKLALPVGVAVPFDQASAAFDHVSAGRTGKAVLLP